MRCISRICYISNMKSILVLLFLFGLCQGDTLQVKGDDDDEEIQDLEQAIARDKQYADGTPHWHDGVGWASSEMGPREFFDINGPDGIESRSNSDQAKDYVQGKIKVYYSIDPEIAMKKLAEVGSLLRLAYAGSKGHSSSSPIIKVMSSYQDLVKDSLITSQAYVEIVLKALKYHKYAAIFVEKDLLEKSIKYLRKCSTMATRMATETQTLIDKSDDLKNLAVDALIAANDDYVGSKAEKAKLTKLINELKLEQAKQESMKGDLNKMVEEAREEERRNGAVAKEKEFLGMIIGIFVPLATTVMTVALPLLIGDEPEKFQAPVLPVSPQVEEDELIKSFRYSREELLKNIESRHPMEESNDEESYYLTEESTYSKRSGGLGGLIGGILGQNKPAQANGGEPGCGGGSGIDGQAAQARCREAAARASRINFQRQQLKNNAALVETVEKLMSTKDSGKKLDQALLGLEVTIKTLGKVKTIFLNAKVFWMGVQKHVLSLAASQEELDDYAEDEDLREEYAEALMESGYSWLTVGKICRLSALKIRHVSNGVDEIMTNLPSEKEAKELVTQIGLKIFGDIKDDTKAIDEELKSKQNQLPLPKYLRLPVTDVTLPACKGAGKTVDCTK